MDIAVAPIPLIWILYGSCGLLLMIAWWPHLGAWRTIFSVLCRMLWVSPLVTLLFPKSMSEALPERTQRAVLHVLIDDSQSVRQNTAQSAALDTALAELQQLCQSYGCRPKLTRFSERSTQVAKGFTPAADILRSWAYGLADDPWVYIGDGGDEYPTVSWDKQLAHLAKTTTADVRGAVIGLRDPQLSNYWLAGVSGPTLAFQDQPVRLSVSVARSDNLKQKERVQIQIESESTVLNSTNAEFAKGDSELQLDLTLAALSRGSHLLRVRILPPAGEKYLWDNDKYISVDVLANTVGVLHLLGAPSSDGRFMRRYLKAEPKYDIISFFILRDPWDMQQQVNERELSLIPFPVKRLFEDELQNFRVVVFQNFSLHQFLDVPFQENLVEYVLNGGSMLFLGGDRALESGDTNSSALAKLLPFNTNGQTQMMFAPGSASYEDRNKNFDPNLEFKIEMADPPQAQREFATVYDDWQQQSKDLLKVGNLKGLHRLDRAVFKKDAYTPLLSARLVDGTTVPLAVASYPGKGRVIWIFTDAIWNIAMNEKVPRQTYDLFLQAAIAWLMRDEVKKPLTVEHLQLRRSGVDALTWTAELWGPAVKFFDEDKTWQLMLCNKSLDHDYIVERIQSQKVRISGTLQVSLPSNQICTLDITAQHKSFGTIKARGADLVPRIFTDEEVGGAWQRVLDLAKLTDANLITTTGDGESKGGEISLSQWISQRFAQSEWTGPAQFKTVNDHYWIFKTPWFYVLMLFLPMEILLRRWHHYFGSASERH